VLEITHRHKKRSAFGTSFLCISAERRIYHDQNKSLPMPKLGNDLFQKFLAHPRRLELPTYRLGVRTSVSTSM